MICWEKTRTLGNTNKNSTLPHNLVTFCEYINVKLNFCPWMLRTWVNKKIWILLIIRFSFSKNKLFVPNGTKNVPNDSLKIIRKKWNNVYFSNKEGLPIKCLTDGRDKTLITKKASLYKRSDLIDIFTGSLRITSNWRK